MSQFLDIVRQQTVAVVPNLRKNAGFSPASFLLLPQYPLGVVMQTNLGDLVATLFAQFMAEYGDEDLASVATAAVLNDLLTRPLREEEAA